METKKVLLVDFGNSNTKWGVAALSTKSFSMTYLDHAEVHTAYPPDALLSHIKDVHYVIYSDVTNGIVSASWLDAFQKSQLITIPFSTQKFLGGLQSDYSTPLTLGLDRYAAIYGGMALFPRACSLLVSLGTATTIDFLEDGCIFRGGLILPGVHLMAKSLHEQTARLPEVALSSETVSTLLGNTTEESIQRGICNAQVGAIAHVLNTFPQITHAAISGGNAPILMPILKALQSTIHFQEEPQMVLLGLWHYANLTLSASE